jgi:cholesterol transport system auxiliary component
VQLAVVDPTAALALDTQRIMQVQGGGIIPVFPDARWADNVPVLVRNHVLAALHNAGYAGAGPSGGEISADFTLTIEVRSFEFDAGATPTASVAFYAQLFDTSGRVAGAQSFAAAEPVLNAENVDAAVTGLTTAYEKAAGDLVEWALMTIESSAASERSAP